MGIIRGNPVTLVALFFGAAVFLTGGLYAYFPIAVRDSSVVSVAIMFALGLSLLFTMMVLARVLWISARSTSRARALRGK